jgi:YHS domain-containing protein
MGSFLLDFLEFVILALFLRALVRNLGSLFGSSGIHVRTTPGGPPKSPTAEPHRGEVARDPVCGMFVSTEVSYRLKRDRETLHFCSRECLEKYQKDVERVSS